MKMLFLHMRLLNVTGWILGCLVLILLSYASSSSVWAQGLKSHPQNSPPPTVPCHQGLVTQGLAKLDVMTFKKVSQGRHASGHLSMNQAQQAQVSKVTLWEEEASPMDCCSQSTHTANNCHCQPLAAQLLLPAPSFDWLPMVISQLRFNPYEPLALSGYYPQPYSPPRQQNT